MVSDNQNPFFEGGEWEVDFTLIEGWLDTLDDKTLESVVSAAQKLSKDGPTTGMPLVKIIKSSKFKNMKELRPKVGPGSQIRILFAFDPLRQAILLLAGDKATGKNNKAKWNSWYRTAIPKADRLFEKHLRELEIKDANS